MTNPTPILATATLALAFTFFACSNDDSDTGGSISYGGQTYRTVQIGTQTWMAENLNYDVEGSRCYGEGGFVYDEKGDKIELSPTKIQTNCAKYGRLYDWITAMALDESCNESECADKVKAKHQGICPSGWHIPSIEEWTTLIDYVGGKATAGSKLKSKNGWDYFPNVSDNTDTYGFSALPGGHYDTYDTSFRWVGGYGYWWSSSSGRRNIGEDTSGAAYSPYMNNSIENADLGGYSSKTRLISVRCVKD